MDELFPSSASASSVVSTAEDQGVIMAATTTEKGQGMETEEQMDIVSRDGNATAGQESSAE